MAGVAPGANDAGLDHALRRFGFRFVSDHTEHEYREWRIATATPFARIGYIGSAPSWFLLLIAIVVLDREAVPTAAPAITGWIVLLVVLTALTFPTAPTRERPTAISAWPLARARRRSATTC